MRLRPEPRKFLCCRLLVWSRILNHTGARGGVLGCVSRRAGKAASKRSTPSLHSCQVRSLRGADKTKNSSHSHHTPSQGASCFVSTEEEDLRPWPYQLLDQAQTEMLYGLHRLHVRLSLPKCDDATEHQSLVSRGARIVASFCWGQHLSHSPLHRSSKKC